MIPGALAKSLAKRLLAAAFACALPAAIAAPATAAETRTVAIHDPILNTTAYTLEIPSGWIFDSAVIQGTKCVGTPFAVFRASSPDGLTSAKSLPRLDWAWADNPRYNPSGASDCLKYSRELSAHEVMRTMLGVLHVAFVHDLPTPNRSSFRTRIAAGNTATFSSKGDQASASVAYSVNTIAIEERLDVSVVCSTSTLALLGRMHACSSFVTRERAPKGRWSQATFEPIGASMHANPDWQAKWTAVMQRNVAAAGAQVSASLQEAGRERTASHNAFMQAQAMRQTQHDQFLASMQRGTDQSMARTSENMNARGRMAGDWADYALDQQKRLDPNTGEISKDSSAYDYTWVNESGKRLQTSDVNDNPNGNGTGNWTLQENVR